MRSTSHSMAFAHRFGGFVGIAPTSTPLGPRADLEWGIRGTGSHQGRTAVIQKGLRALIERESAHRLASTALTGDARL